MTDRFETDSLEGAWEDEDSLEPLEQDLALEREREEAQGVEVFEDPDRVLPGDALREGRPGRESFSPDSVGLGREEDRETGEPGEG